MSVCSKGRHAREHCHMLISNIKLETEVDQTPLPELITNTANSEPCQLDLLNDN